jgi:UDP-glucuronate 4-epimerase
MQFSGTGIRGNLVGSDASVSSVTILVTGSAGFIGYHVSQALLANGHDVVGFDNFNDYYDPQLKRDRDQRLSSNPRFTSIRGDISERNELATAFANAPRMVIHLAAQAGVRYSITNPEAYTMSNLVGFANVLEACRQAKVHHLLFASSSSVYGDNPSPPFSVDHNTDRQVSYYGATKKANEVMAHSYSHLYKIPITGLRFFTVYGPWGRPDMAYFSFTRAISEGAPITLYNQGNLSRDFTYIDDVVEAMVRLLRAPFEADVPYRLFNIGNHQPVVLREFVAEIERALGKNAVIRYAEMQAGDVLYTHADCSRLAKLVGFAPSTDLRTGITAFCKWYLEYYRA